MLVRTAEQLLADVGAVAQGSPLGVGGQNVWYEENGAFTGELAPRMLREVGADRVLIGHSERRHVFHEPSDWMGRKVRAALDADLLPIYCIGETLSDRKANRTDRVLKKQLEAGFEHVRGSAGHGPWRGGAVHKHTQSGAGAPASKDEDLIIRSISDRLVFFSTFG